jgi:hypothetical protein
MNSFLRSLAILTAGSLLSGGLVHAGASYPNSSNNNTDNSAIRRANPNSRQGTESISPPVRGPNLSPSPSRTPTLENRGIGNSYPNRQGSSPRPLSNAPGTR